MEEEITFEQHMEALDYVHNYMEQLSLNPAAFEEEDIDKMVKNWPEDVQEAWRVAKDWGDEEEIY